MNNAIKGLSIVATPIGNLEDITYRAVKVLKECDIIICENPKHSLKLLNKLGIKKKLIPLHDYNEQKIIDQIKNFLKMKSCVLISDAGSPLISDPGYNLVQYCINNNIKVTSVPGPSSVISALQLSGLPLSEFIFYGFVPKSKNKLKELIKIISEEKRTSILFISSHKLIYFLECLEKIMPDRSIAICKELTKLNEFVFRGVSKNVKNYFMQKKENLKGEFVAIIDKQILKNQDFEEIDLYKQELKKMSIKFSLTDTVEIVHKFTNINKNKIYKWLLELKKLGILITTLFLFFSFLNYGCSPANVLATGGGSAMVVAEGERSLGTVIDDATIKVNIAAKFLSADNNLFVNINTSVLEGRVLLTGLVDNQEIRIEAVRLVWEVEGVREIVNEVEVGNRSTLKDYASDLWINTQARAVAAKTIGLKAITYNFETIQGKIYIAGITKKSDQLNELISALKSIKGVSEIVNYVIVK